MINVTSPCPEIEKGAPGGAVAEGSLSLLLLWPKT